MKDNFYEFLFKLRESGFRHHTPEYEKKMMQELAGGDRMIFIRFWEQLDGEPGVLSPNDLKNARNMVIGMNFLLCRQAINHQVDSELAFSVSDYYINLVEDCRSLSDYHELMGQMMLQYSKIISKDKALPFTLPVNRCILYVKRNLYGRITVGEIAEYLQLNPSYLSALFRKETGTRLHEYIHARKIEEAKIMMENTSNSLTTIASALGYSSLGHFSKVFKQYTGSSPKSYHSHADVI